MTLIRIQAYATKTPLLRPYKLSFGPVDAYRSIYVRVETENGVGWGETTPLPGYSLAMMDSAAAATAQLASQWIGANTKDMLAHLPELDGFNYAGLYTAAEEAAGLAPVISGVVPLSAMTQEDACTPTQALHDLRSKGYTVFKIKLGGVPAQADAKRITAYQDAMQPGEWLRMDANQGLTLDDAKRLLDVCNPAKVQFFEQPLPVEEWENTRTLQQGTPVTIMLDEAIDGEASLERAAGVAKAVKFKLMKQGSFGRLATMCRRARDLGLAIVLGNGVASGLGNWHECRFWLTELADLGIAAESNGFLKPISGTLPDLLKLNSPHAVVEPLSAAEAANNFDKVITTTGTLLFDQKA